MNDQVCRSTPREDPDRIAGTLFPRGRMWRLGGFAKGLSRPVWYDCIFVYTACEFVMRTRGGQARVHDRRDPDFRAIYRLGGLRGFAHAMASRPSLIAYSFPGLANSHAVAAVVCTLTRLENWLEQKAGVEPHHGGFLTIFPNWFIRIFPPR